MNAIMSLFYKPQKSLHNAGIPGSLLLAILCLLLVICVSVYSCVNVWNYSRQQLEHVQTLEHTANINRQQQVQQQQQADLLTEFGTAYQQLQTAGIVGTEQRLLWLEQLDWLQQSLALPKINVIFQKQQKLESWQGNLAEYMDIYRSHMELELDILQIEDFFVLLERFKQRVNGLYWIDFCAMHWKSGVSFLHRKQSNITVQCQLSWFTIQVEKNKIR